MAETAPGGLRTVDEAANPYLSGRFAPVNRETDADDLRVDGTLPADIDGVFMRNGPNPKFPPLGSYTFPLEGDGMIHAVWISGGKARYRNRWVRTNDLKAEERAGRALFGGIMTPAFVDQGLLGPDPDPGWPFKLDAFINVIRHAGHYLALEEGSPPYEVGPGLETIGRFDFGGGLPLGMCAHPRIDPVTGDLVVFRYDVTEPYLTWAVVGRDGTVTRPPDPVPGLDASFMVHDFTITEHYALFVIGPAILDVDAMLTGGSMLSWQPERGTRIAVVPRAGNGPARMAGLDPLWAWHFANAYEDGDRVIADFPSWDELSLAAGDRRAAADQRQPVTGRLTRVSVDPARGTATLTEVAEVASEFPRIDDRLTGRRHRYLTTGAVSGAHELIRGEHDRLIRWDMDAGTHEAWDTDASIGEVIFVPRQRSAGELDGYYMSLARGLADDRSWLYIWDAGDFPGPPQAKVEIPAVVPNGLHANWFPLEVPS